MPRLRTFMSPVLSRYPAESAGDQDVGLEAVTVTTRAGSEKKLFWLDEMLEGGLELPRDLWDRDHGGPSFVLLLGGPPGTGKTTFALELCYNLARHDQPRTKMPWSSLYVSVETPGDRIRDNALDFGWDEQYFAVRRRDDLALDWPLCNIYGSENFRGAGPEDPFDPCGAVRDVVDRYLNAFPRAGQERHAPKLNELRITHETIPPDVLVLDSLNLLWPQQPGPAQAPAPAGGLLEVYHRVIAGIGGGRPAAKRPKLLVIVLDGFDGDGAHNAWEFLADAAVRFDWAVGGENYHTRSFQINKIKTQTHALGNNHVFKVVARTTAGSPGAGGAAPAPEGAAPQPDERPRNVDRVQGIPYLRSGGTFVYPSIHWHLSRSIRENPVPGFERRENYRTGLPELDAILGGAGSADVPGFPSMHTTALIGRRGGMKSHLAYHFMLSHAVGTPVAGDGKGPKNVLLVSLRDDPDAARDTLVRLIEQQQLAGPAAAAPGVLDGLLAADRLEILYNWPGCVTPNEFFHRIYVALARKRRGRRLGEAPARCGLGPGTLSGDVRDAVPGRDTAEIVVLNGLDHLDVKFPLCAGEPVFVPALVSLFRCFKVCSVVISGEDRPGGSYDIRPLADLILDFSDFDPCTHHCAVPQGVVQTSRVSAVRVPAGQVGGLWGVLGRGGRGAMDFYRPESAAPATGTGPRAPAGPRP